jgi:hypothetical protein|mmetsp:Transcript_21847/g.46103  ORF Transcript_21847/g.46103 Transcript_21847/m.46103 type:complete len:86 (-) Transcript_21847:2099-2356(-)
MFQVRLLLCLIILAFVQGKTQFIRGEIVNPASRVIVNNHEKTSRKEQRTSSSSGPGMKGTNHLQNILEFQAAKKFSGSQPTRKAP